MSSSSPSSVANSTTTSTSTTTTTTNSNERRHKPLHHTLASQGAGAVSTVLFFPIDVVKMRFMSQDGTAGRMHNGHVYTSTIKSMREIAAVEGVGSLFRGSHVAVGGSVTAWGVYMYTYRHANELLSLSASSSSSQQQQPSSLTSSRTPSTTNNNTTTTTSSPPPPTATTSSSSSTTNFAAKGLVSTAASSLSSVLVTPIFLVKTRMQVEDRAVVQHNISRMMMSAAASSSSSSPSSSPPPPPQQHYRTFIGSVRHILATTGPRSLWRGLSAQLLLGVPNAFNLPIYDALKSTRLTQTQREHLTVPEVLLCTATTKSCLVILSQPLFLLKTRLQDHRARIGHISSGSSTTTTPTTTTTPDKSSVRYIGLLDTFKTTVKREGVWGLFRGTSPALMQAIPRSAVHFFVYEGLLRVLGDK